MQLNAYKDKDFFTQAASDEFVKIINELSQQYVKEVEKKFNSFVQDNVFELIFNEQDDTLLTNDKYFS